MNTSPNVIDGAYAINLDEYKSIRTHQIAFMWMAITRHILVVLDLNMQIENEFKIKRAIKMERFFIGEIQGREKKLFMKVDV